MKLKRLILFVLAITYCSYSFAQGDTVKYSILRNDPKNINNMFVYAMPINFDFSTTYINITYGFGAEYNHRDKFVLGIDFKRSYTEKFNNLMRGNDDEYSLYQKAGNAMGGEKKLY